jgi:hypothetical protein
MAISIMFASTHVMRVMTVITIISHLAVWRSECERLPMTTSTKEAESEPPARILSTNKPESFVCLISEVEMEDASGWWIAAKSIWACH